jgi:predicted metal-dependent hydrolase
MWRWHLAEEYEHREVVWRVYHRLFGTPVGASHDFRLEMFDFGTNHFFGYSDQMRRAMLATYRDGMTPDELRASQEREEQILAASKERLACRLAPVFSPDYNPAANPRPAQLDEVLSTYTVGRH